MPADCRPGQLSRFRTDGGNCTFRAATRPRLPTHRPAAGRTAPGQVRASPLDDCQDTATGRGNIKALPEQKTKEVFEMAASLFIEEDSGVYTARPRHPHNGYYAGDFFETSRSDSSPRGSHDEPRPW